tara:strand:- start:238 stop:744 length:507 start_codon:yes stop_codon:yes gene_type:complete
MNYLKISLGIFVALAASRFIPHPPNFTSLIAIGFYIPAIFGRNYIFAVLMSFVITDIFIGFHNTLFFTWGSIVLIGLISKYFKKSFIKRLGGSLLGCCIFYIITNFGVWMTGLYGYSLSGLLSSYFLAIPFFGYTIISTIIYAFFIELIIKIFVQDKYFSIYKYFLKK